MNTLQSVFLGILQGLTEFLPVSSSGHLVVFRDVLGIEGIPLFYDVLLHGATLVVICTMFRERIAELARSAWLTVTGKVPEAEAKQCSTDMRTILTIFIATLWTGAVGMVISQFHDNIPVSFVYGMFLVTSALLISGKLFSSISGGKGFTITNSTILGISQGLAVLPGISRSGATISAALMCGIDRKKAGEISFLISIPAVLGALLLEVAKVPDVSGSVSAQAMAAGFLAALVSGFAALKLLLFLLRGGRLYLFSMYLIPLGLYGLIFNT